MQQLLRPVGGSKPVRAPLPRPLTPRPCAPVHAPQRRAVVPVVRVRALPRMGQDSLEDDIAAQRRATLSRAIAGAR